MSTKQKIPFLITALSAILCCAAVNADAATIQVIGRNSSSAVGNPNSGDFGAVLKAVNDAAPGDVIELSGVFRFSDAAGAPSLNRGIRIAKSLTIRAASGGARITGPGTGPFNGSRAAAFNIVQGGNNVAIDGIAFAQFEATIIADGPLSNLTVSNNNFSQTLTAFFGFNAVGSKIVGNTIATVGGSNAVFGGAIVSFNVKQSEQAVNSYLNNTIVGPGAGKSGKLSGAIVERTVSPQLLTSPIVDNNKISNFDTGLDLGEVTKFGATNNSIGNCNIGILVVDLNPSDYSDSGAPASLDSGNDGLISNNALTNNKNGLGLFNAERNTISNNAIQQSEIGYVQDTGSVEKPTSGNELVANTFKGNESDLQNDDMQNPLNFETNTFDGSSVPKSSSDSKGAIQPSDSVPAPTIASVITKKKTMTVIGTSLEAGSQLIVNGNTIVKKGSPIAGKFDGEGLVFKINVKKLKLNKGGVNAIQVLSPSGARSAEFSFVFKGTGNAASARIFKSEFSLGAEFGCAQIVRP